MKKRKYTRKALESKSSGINYESLPITLRNEIECIIEGRKCLGLPDDSVERKERAVRYWESRQ